VARTDAGGCKAAQIIAADKEPVLQQHLLPTPAENIAALDIKAQHPLRGDRIIITEICLVSDIFDTKPSSGQIVSKRGIISVGRVLTIIAAIVQQDLTNCRSYMRSRLKLNKQRRVALNIGN